MAQVESFQDHIKELRMRVLWVAGALLATAGIAYSLHQPIIKFLQKPYGQTLIFTSPAGSFEFVIQLSVIVGMFVALPMIIYQLLRFLEPALPHRISRGMMLRVMGSSCLLALMGIAFGFFVMIPISLKFFLGFTMEEVKPLITAEEYLKFVLNHMLTFALAFQIPMIFWFINRIKPIKPSKLLKYQKHVVVGSFGIALVLPFTYDPLSQFLVAMPVIVLYYSSVLLVWLSNRKIVWPVETAANAATPITEPDPIPIEPTPLPALPVEPELEPQPAKPVFAFDNIRPTKRPLTMDGFLAGQSQLSPRAAAATVSPAKTISKPVTMPSVRPVMKQPRLSIDGIRPPLPSTSST